MIEPTRHQDNSNQAAQLVRILGVFQKVLKEVMIEVTPYTEASIAKFTKLTLTTQNRIIKDLEHYVRTLYQYNHTGGSIKDTKSLTEFALKQNNWMTCDNFMSQLNDDDVVEIYRTDFTQLYRNLKFLEVCSYPISELYIAPWTELYRRPQQITDSVVNSIIELLDSGEMKTIKCSVPSHFLEERYSEKRYLYKIDQKLFSPVFTKNTKELIGFIGSLSADILTSKKHNSTSDFTKIRPLSL